MFFDVISITFPETNSSHLKIGHPKRKRSYSNHPFSGANLLFVSANIRPQTPRYLENLLGGSVGFTHSSGKNFCHRRRPKKCQGGSTPPYGCLKRICWNCLTNATTHPERLKSSYFVMGTMSWYPSICSSATRFNFFNFFNPSRAATCCTWACARKPLMAVEQSNCRNTRNVLKSNFLDVVLSWSEETSFLQDDFPQKTNMEHRENNIWKMMFLFNTDDFQASMSDFERRVFPCLGVLMFLATWKT